MDSPIPEASQERPAEAGREALDPEEMTFLYRFFGEGERLLYVGITGDLRARNQQHSRKSWWPQVVKQTVEVHPGRPAAEAAERAAIRDERPRHNVTGSPVHAEVVQAERLLRPYIVEEHPRGLLFKDRATGRRLAVVDPACERVRANAVALMRRNDRFFTRRRLDGLLEAHQIVCAARDL